MLGLTLKLILYNMQCKWWIFQITFLSLFGCTRETVEGCKDATPEMF